MEQENVTTYNPTVDDVFCTNQKEHLFASHSALCDFVMVFKINSYNVRYGQTKDGKLVYQLIYEAHNN